MKTKNNKESFTVIIKKYLFFMKQTPQHKIVWGIMDEDIEKLIDELINSQHGNT